MKRSLSKSKVTTAPGARNWLFTIFAGITGVILGVTAVYMWTSVGADAWAWLMATLLTACSVLSFVSAYFDKPEWFSLGLLGWWS